MAFNPNIPQPSDQLSQSQQDILNNFQAIQALVDVNHVDFASSDQGKHKWITFPSQGAIPPAGSGFTGTELGLYNAVYSTTGKQELFVNKTNQITVVQVPFTASILSTSSAPTSGTGFWTYLPSGLLMIGGNATGTLTGLNMNTIGAPAPTLTQLLSVVVCPYNPTSTGDLNFAVRLVDINGPNTFRVYISSRTSTGAATGQTGYSYLAIGY